MNASLVKSPVLLVGAGPGDPELLTLKAVKAIAQASVILVDDLVNPEVLKHARSEARVTWVGKRGGCASTPQAFIQKLMVREALAGEKVVRLKGGDPLIFGRAGEEISALSAAGLAFEIVSGISSAMAAAASAQVSLTHRDCSHGVVFITAHLATAGQANIDWPMLLKAGLTVGFYMGVSRSSELHTQAIQAQLDQSIPVLVVQHASANQQKRVLTTIGQLPQAISEHGICSPAVLLMGKALALASADHYCLEEHLPKAVVGH
jgi:uroporphyrin-III C-methyltransferase